MTSTVLLALGGISAYFCYSNISGLQKNIAAAKRSGLPYIITRMFYLEHHFLGSPS
jgi:hypothetical protein